ncbi:MAG: Ig-like domain-containing protein, partial [Clostridia bacterium]|nr:Ig-like domain-containing protein [Clostridia bacterium]
MKKLLTLIIVVLLSFSFPTSAAIGSKGLILENGKDLLVLKKGQKEYLNVQDGLTKLFLFKEISYYSDNTIVATVGLHSGILRANNIGTATITAISKSGDAGQIKIKVVAPKKSFYLPFFFFVSFSALFLWFLIKK